MFRIRLVRSALTPWPWRSCQHHAAHRMGNLRGEWNKLGNGTLWIIGEFSVGQREDKRQYLLTCKVSRYSPLSCTPVLSSRARRGFNQPDSRFLPKVVSMRGQLLPVAGPALDRLWAGVLCLQGYNFTPFISLIWTSTFHGLRGGGCDCALCCTLPRWPIILVIRTGD